VFAIDGVLARAIAAAKLTDGAHVRQPTRNQRSALENGLIVGAGKVTVHDEVHGSIAEKVWSQLIFSNVLACLSENGAKCAGVQFFVPRNRQCLFLTQVADASKFHVAASLSMYGESKALEYRGDCDAG
jgi:hypothetical protein